MERVTQMNGQQGEISRMSESEDRDCKMRDAKQRPPQNHLAIASIELVGCMAGVEDSTNATMRQGKHVAIFMHMRRF
jgi:hypothetical protein